MFSEELSPDVLQHVARLDHQDEVEEQLSDYALQNQESPRSEVPGRG